jgi:acetyl esterase/lipase
MRMFRALAAAILVVALAGFAAWRLSPWPSALFYRFLFDRGGVAMNEALAAHAPRDVVVHADIRYGTGPAETLDSYLPAGAAHALPVVFWIHGGAFISGDKGQLANYLKIIAAAGYAAIGIDYALAPAAQHPVPTRQANAALAYMKANAGKLGIDPDRVVLAGDSAGAQIAAQLGIAVTDPDFAASIGITPAIPASALRGLVLHCGIYDLGLLKPNGAMGGFLKAVAWSYFGTKNVAGPAAPAQFSIVRNMSRAMPPLFISAGNADPLLPHSMALAEAARQAGVKVDTLFFSANYTPRLEHEYELNLDTEAGRLALRRSLAFIAERVE